MKSDDQIRKAEPSRRNNPPDSSDPTSMGRRPEYTGTGSTAVSTARESSYASGNSSKGQIDASDFEIEPDSGRHDDYVATASQRRWAPDISVLDRVGTKSALQRQETSFSSLVANDSLTLVQAALTLPRALYPVWKWLLLLYFRWLVLTYLAAFLDRSATTSLAPMCANPLLGSQLPFCTWSPDNEHVSAAKVAASLDGLTVV